jgi:hypothetical protein
MPYRSSPMAITSIPNFMKLLGGKQTHSQASDLTNLLSFFNGTRLKRKRGREGRTGEEGVWWWCWCWWWHLSFPIIYFRGPLRNDG